MISIELFRMVIPQLAKINNLYRTKFCIFNFINEYILKGKKYNQTNTHKETKNETQQNKTCCLSGLGTGLGSGLGGNSRRGGQFSVISGAKISPGQNPSEYPGQITHNVHVQIRPQPRQELRLGPRTNRNTTRFKNECTDNVSGDTESQKYKSPLLSRCCSVDIMIEVWQTMKGTADIT